MKKSIYIAVLNQGEISTDLSETLRRMAENPYYEVLVTYPNNKPISHNRNLIVQDFLSRKEYDYLLMIDGDIIPPPTIVNLADYQLDVVGGTCFMYQQNEIMPVAFKRKSDGLYIPIDIEGNDGLTEVDAIGSGCIMISRKVLEDVKSPFSNIYDADGIKIWGLDISFCQKAKEKGYKIYIHTDYICGHITTVNLKTFYAIHYSLMSEIKRLKEKQCNLTTARQKK